MTPFFPQKCFSKCDLKLPRSQNKVNYCSFLLFNCKIGTRGPLTQQSQSVSGHGKIGDHFILKSLCSIILFSWIKHTSCKVVSVDVCPPSRRSQLPWTVISTAIPLSSSAIPFLYHCTASPFSPVSTEVGHK